MSTPLAIVGGGPAGMAAALEAADAGLACTILDEAPLLGGQIYRAAPHAFAHVDAAAAGRDHARGEAMRADVAAASDRIDVRSGTSVVGIWERELLWVSDEASGSLDADQLILATGSYDRPVPFPGWTLPGVLTAGGAQSLVKTMRVRPGHRALVAGTGPLLLVVANQLHKVGVEVVAVLEAGRPPLSPRALAGVWGQRELLADAWRYVGGLRRAGIPLRFGHTVFEAHGTDAVDGATFGPVDRRTWRPLRDRAERVDVDLLVVGFGFVPNTALAALADCRMAYVHDVGGWVPERSALMETTASGVFAVGDGAGVAGALVAVDEGRVAGITGAERAGALTRDEADRRRAAPLRRLRRMGGVRRLLDELSRIRPGLADLATPDTIACRCEEVARAEVDHAMAEGARDLQAVKLLTRLGMGACQGRNCGPSMGLHLAAALGVSPADVGRIRARPPIKPVTIGMLANGDATWALDGEGEPERTPDRATDTATNTATNGRER
ncbi:MAG: FAD/NAD(P)-binding oxidoreductase [Ardenticatenales bacterium]